MAGHLPEERSRLGSDEQMRQLVLVETFYSDRMNGYELSSRPKKKKRGHSEFKPNLSLQPDR